jgi:hypothetical protein
MSSYMATQSIVFSSFSLSVWQSKSLTAAVTSLGKMALRPATRSSARQVDGIQNPQWSVIASREPGCFKEKQNSSWYHPVEVN